MKEINDIVRAYDLLLQQEKQAALATVVHIEGSSYRKPGARMLIDEDGKLTGAISGGCLENDILRKAMLVMTQKKPALITYDSRDEDDRIGISLGCNGLVQIFIEPLVADDPKNPIGLLKHLSARREKAVLVTVFSAQNFDGYAPGTCLLILKDSTTIGSLPDLSVKNELLADSKAVFRLGEYATISYSSEGKCFKAFIDYILPQVSLVIVGGGNDAMPVAAMADVLGWQVIVVDGRPQYATQARFPTALQVLVARPEKITSKLRIDEQTVFVLMTHNYNYDFAALKDIVRHGTPYIGILGPQKKQERLLDDLEIMGVSLDNRQRTKIFGPVGLDIGAETPEEIALSIIAEIKRVLAGAPGHSLRENRNRQYSGWANSLATPSL